jgi:hypothetical protein
VNGDTAAKTRLLDPRCTSACAAEDKDALTPDAALTGVVIYTYPDDINRVIAVGDEPGDDGQTRAFLIDYIAGTAAEAPLREPRRGATPILTPVGTLALMGGVHPDGTPALTIETFFPE